MNGARRAIVAREPLAFAALTLVAAAIVVLLPVIPGHDVPQHLAYVRLLVDWRTDPHRLADLYSEPDVSNVYATLYRVMAFVAYHSSPNAGLRVVLALYVVFLAIAVRALVRATWRDSPPATAVLGPVVALNPVLCMGLLPYVVALVPFVASIAAAIHFAATGKRRWLGVVFAFAFITACCHGVASAALLLFLGILLTVTRAWRQRWRPGLALGAAAIAIVGNGLAFGPVAHRPDGLGRALVHNVRTYGLFAGTVGTFRLSFTHWLQKLEQVVASVLGPFPLAAKVLVAASALAVFLLWRTERQRIEQVGTRTGDRHVKTVHRAVVLFGLAAIAAPAALQVPDDLSLLDFRLITTATILGVVLVPPRVFARSRVAGHAIIAASLAVLLLWARQLNGAATEVMQTVHLLDRLRPQDRLLALPMRDRSAFLDERNAVLHYAAVHHTAITGGLTSLFWGRFSVRLPVGYKPGREPSHPADWAPWELTDAQLDEFSHVMVRWPAANEHEEPRFLELAARVVLLRDRGRLETIACDGDCCLFRVSEKVTRLVHEERGFAP